MKKQAGFTLLETMTVCVLAFILFGIAIPAANDGLEAARSADARSKLLSSLTDAASRASISGTKAVLCPSADSFACDDTIDWSLGWIVFMDRNGNREREPDEPLINAVQALEGGVRMHSTVGRTRIVFQGNAGNAGSNVSFTQCDDRGPGKARSLIMSNTGRLRDAPASEKAAQSICKK
ncbi:MAG: GspH/FimT family pseudopilin [Arenimonas sp.]